MLFPVSNRKHLGKSGCYQETPQNSLKVVSTSTFRGGAPATSVAFGDSQSPSLLVKSLLTGVVPHCGHRSSHEQRGQLWMTKDVRTHSRKRSVPIPSPDGKEITVAQQKD